MGTSFERILSDNGVPECGSVLIFVAPTAVFGRRFVLEIALEKNPTCYVLAG
jgi:hypothetical protein